MTNEGLLIQISKLYNSYADGGIGSLDECQESILALIQQFRESCSPKVEPLSPELEEFVKVFPVPYRYSTVNGYFYSGESLIGNMLLPYATSEEANDAFNAFIVSLLNAHFEKGKQ